MRVFAIGIEDALDVAVDGLQGGDAGKFERPALLGRTGQNLCHGEDGGHVALGFRYRLAEVRDGLAQGSPA
jgi:hypothetical protein